MRAKHIVSLLLCALAMPFASVAQEPSSSGSTIQQENHPMPILEPRQLRQIPQSEIRDVLATHGDLGSERDAKGLAAATPALPVFSYSDGACGNPPCTGTIVGSFPTNAVTTNVNIFWVPVILNITVGSNTWVFDPTAADPGCLGAGNTALSLTQQSPFVVNEPWVINGWTPPPTQFLDAFQHAEFAAIANANNHLLLTQSLWPTLVINVSSPSGAVFGFANQCGTNPFPTNQGGVLGVVDANTVNPVLQNYIAGNANIQPSDFVFFILYNAVMSSGAPTSNLSNCCILGFHSTFGAGQTYGIADFDGRHQTLFTGVTDTSVMAHEIGEWANDPFANNVVPNWGNVGQVSGCPNPSLLEVGDPLSGTLIGQTFTIGGFTYHFQELAFFSWFTRDNPSLGEGGKYSSNGTLVRPSQPCPPGGK